MVSCHLAICSNLVEMSVPRAIYLQSPVTGMEVYHVCYAFDIFKVTEGSLTQYLHKRIIPVIITTLVTASEQTKGRALAAFPP